MLSGLDWVIFIRVVKACGACPLRTSRHGTATGRMDRRKMRLHRMLKVNQKWTINVMKAGKKKLSSYIEERSRIYHEDIPIPGTDVTLHYASNRVKGYHQKISVPVSGDTVPVSLKRIIARMDLAGRSFEQNLDPLPNQMAEFVWHGLDHLGRPLLSPVNARVSMGFVYDAVYLNPGDFMQAFAQAGGQGQQSQSQGQQPGQGCRLH